MKKLCALLYIKFFPQQDDTNIVNFDEGVFDSMAVFSEAMSFSRFSLQKSQFTYRKCSIVWLPRVKCLLLLCKAEPAWIKRNIHYVILQHYTPGKLLKEIPPYLKSDFWYKRSEFWKWHWLRKMALKFKRPSSKSLILVSFCWKKNVYIHITALTNLISSLISLKLVIVCVAFFLGHPV